MYFTKSLKKIIVMIILISFAVLSNCNLGETPNLNVYICGGDGSNAKCWKNGVEQPALTDGTNAATAMSIFVAPGI